MSNSKIIILTDFEGEPLTGTNVGYQNTLRFCESDNNPTGNFINFKPDYLHAKP
jgi:hypothetical protein